MRGLIVCFSILPFRWNGRVFAARTTALPVVSISLILLLNIPSLVFCPNPNPDPHYH